MLSGNCLFRRIIGCVLAFIGVILLICFMPFWLWLVVLGLVLLTVGCIVLVRGLN